MKLQVDVFLSKIKKEYVWILILVGLVTVDLILRWVNVNKASSSLTEYLSLIGFPTNHEYNFTNFLIFIYEFVMVIYYVYVYYVHDLENSFEQIVLRVSGKNWIINKIILSGLFVFLMSTIYVLIVYLFFSGDVIFKIEYLIYPLSYHLLITYLVITVINFINRKNYVIYPLLIGFVLITFMKFNIYVSLVITVLLLLINIKSFHFKTYYQNKH